MITRDQVNPPKFTKKFMGYGTPTLSNIICLITISWYLCYVIGNMQQYCLSGIGESAWGLLLTWCLFGTRASATTMLPVKLTHADRLIYPQTEFIEMRFSHLNDQLLTESPTQIYWRHWVFLRYMHHWSLPTTRGGRDDCCCGLGPGMPRSVTSTCRSGKGRCSLYNWRWGLGNSSWKWQIVVKCTLGIKL